MMPSAPRMNHARSRWGASPALREAPGRDRAGGVRRRRRRRFLLLRRRCCCWHRRGRAGARVAPGADTHALAGMAGADCTATASAGVMLGAGSACESQPRMKRSTLFLSLSLSLSAWWVCVAWRACRASQRSCVACSSPSWPSVMKRSTVAPPSTGPTSQRRGVGEPSPPARPKTLAPPLPQDRNRARLLATACPAPLPPQLRRCPPPPAPARPRPYALVRGAGQPAERAAAAHGLRPTRHHVGGAEGRAHALGGGVESGRAAEGGGAAAALCCLGSRRARHRCPRHQRLID
jgi:hypothetical protein